MYHMKNDKAGISPVIATLILVLIAVAAGVAFYAWQSGWQENATSNIGDGDAKVSLTIAGSTTVYPFTAAAAEMYMKENPSVEVSFQKGGSGAGRTSVRNGIVDIGSASSSTPADPAYPTEKQIPIAYDAVVVVMDAGTIAYYGLPATGFTQAQLRAVFEATTQPTWAALGATVNPTENVIVYHRSDESGTEESFNVLLMGRSGQISDTGKGTWWTGVPSNQEMITAIQADKATNKAIGFASFSSADTAGAANVEIASYQVSAGPPIVTQTPNKSTISATIKDSAKATLGTGYKGVRAIYYLIEQDSVTPIAEDYLNFVQAPENNQQICIKADFFSIYQ